jgi:lipopolysaccharide exporter
VRSTAPLRLRAAAGMRWTAAASACIVFTQVLQLLVLARHLSPTDFGLIGLLLLIVGFARAYTDLGFSAALIYRQDATNDERSSLYWLNVIAGFSVAAVVAATAQPVSHLMREPRLTPYLQTLALLFLIVPLGKQFEVLLEKALRFKRIAMQDVGSNVGGTVVLVVLLELGAGVWAFVLATLATAGLKSLALVAIGIREDPPRRHFAWKDVKSYLSFGLYQVAESTIQFVTARTDQILVAGFVGTEALGFYNFALNLTSQPASRINPIVTRVAFPAFAAIQGDAKRLGRGFVQMLRLLTTINAPLLIGLAAVSPTAIPTIFGTKWTGSVELVQLLSIVCLSRSIGNPIGSLQLARGRADLGFRWNVLVVLVSVPVMVSGAELGGATGVAGALVGLQVVVTVVSYYLLVRPLADVDSRAYFSAICRPLLLTLPMVGVILLTAAMGARNATGRDTIAQIGAGAAAYLATLALLDRPGLRSLASLVARPGRAA